MEASKLEKKLKRKVILLQQKLPDDCRLVISAVPTIYVLIGNGGLDSGVSSELVMFILKQAVTEESIRGIHMARGYDSSIVVLKDTESSEAVIRKLNGQCVQELVTMHEPDRRRYCYPYMPETLLKEDSQPFHLLMAYITEVPQVFHTTTVSDNPVLPPGCYLMVNFITDDEEIQLLSQFSYDFTRSLDSLKHCKEWERSVQSEPAELQDVSLNKSGGPGDGFATDTKPVPERFTHLKLRTVHHYGYEFIYGKNTVDPTMPLPGGLPTSLNFLISRILKTGLIEHHPDQLTVNEYEPGAGIPRHVDTHSAFKDGISLITLGSHTLMQFQCGKDSCSRNIDVVLPRKSLLVMSKESRYLWTHWIPARRSDVVSPFIAGVSSLRLKSTFEHCTIPRFTRVSLTLRKILCAPCNCGYPLMCDNHT